MRLTTIGFLFLSATVRAQGGSSPDSDHAVLLASITYLQSRSAPPDGSTAILFDRALWMRPDTSTMDEILNDSLSALGLDAFIGPALQVMPEIRFGNLSDSHSQFCNAVVHPECVGRTHPRGILEDGGTYMRLILGPIGGDTAVVDVAHSYFAKIVKRGSPPGGLMRLTLARTGSEWRVVSQRMLWSS